LQRPGKEKLMPTSILGARGRVCLLLLLLAQVALKAAPAAAQAATPASPTPASPTPAPATAAAAAPDAASPPATAAPSASSSAAPASGSTAATPSPSSATPAGAPPAAAPPAAAPAVAGPSAAAPCYDTDPALPSSPRLAKLQGVIAAPGEDDLQRVRLTLHEKTTSNVWSLNHVVHCEHGDGRFAYATEVPPGTYDLSLAVKGYESENISGLTLEANQTKRQGFALVKDVTRVHTAVLWLPALFLLSIWMVRWNNIAKPSRLGVIAQIAALKGRFPAGSKVPEVLATAELELDRKWSVLDWLFWSRGQEIASWNLIHKAELALLEDAPPEKVNARLASAEQRLAEIDRAGAKSLADRIGGELKCDAAKIDDKARRQLLIEASSYVYDYGDTEFATLTSWQNKAFWLTLLGVALISAVGIAQGHVSLFVAGAVGGFLSRMTRELKRADVPSDYGASWSSLFLSPVAGAIMGWFGVALVMLLSDPNVGVLGGPLKVISWDSDNVAATMGAAFLLGFSERLFDKIVAQLEQSIDKKEEGAQKAGAKPVQAPAVAARPGITSLSPNPAAAGSVVAAQLTNLDAGKVTGVVLVGSAGDEPTLAPSVDDGQLNFTLAANTAPGSYRIVLLTPDRTETDQELTVSSA
jgi:hypothetical protein